MKISLNWIKDYVDIEGIDTEWLINKITVTTAEVEGVEYKGKDIENIIVGKIISMETHPNSEKLKVIKVFTGEEEVLSVCGAPNVYEGMLIPFAKVGSLLPEIGTIKVQAVNGISSFGIACSEKELGISSSHEGVLDLTTVGTVGQNIKELIDIEDIVFEIDNKSLTNRPDLWCHYGIAREVSAITGRELKAIDGISEEKLKELKGESLKVDIEEREKVLRYSAIKIDNIKINKSPLNITVRLYYCGMRPINLIVDLSNYVMLDLGQPLHTFDSSYMESIKVEAVKDKRNFITLDGAERELKEGILMISNGDKYAAIAGIMGGVESEVKESTKGIILEAATFEGVSIRKSASKLGMRTDASARYEKFIDTALTTAAIGRFLRLLFHIDSSIKVVSCLYDNIIKKVEPIDLVLKHEYIETYLGNKIDKEKVTAILHSLKFSAEEKDGSYFVKVPTFRATKDITSKADLAEEILRMYGYENIKSVAPKMDMKPQSDSKMKIMEMNIKDLLVKKFAFNEIHSYSWYDNLWLKKISYNISKDTIKIANSSIKQYDTLRDDMLPNLMQIAFENRKSYTKFNIFEIGRSYIKGENCSQHKHLTALIYESNNKAEKDIFFHMKGLIGEIIKELKNVEIEFEYLEEDKQLINKRKALNIICDNQVIGYLGSVSDEIKRLYGKGISIVILDIDLELLKGIEKNKLVFQEISKYPETYLDFSIVSERVMPYGTLKKTISNFKRPEIKNISYIDCYEGEKINKGTKSTTVRMKLGSDTKTLEINELEEINKAFVEYLQIYNLEIRK